MLFESVAQNYGPSATGIILTGMGNDGASGLGQLLAAGGHTMAQDKDSSAVYGMPRIATEKGFAEEVLALTSMPSFVTSIVGTIPQPETVYAHKL